MNVTYYSGEISALIREHGYEGTARILAERRKAAQTQGEPTQGDSCELSEDEWRQQVEANRRGAYNERHDAAQREGPQ